MRMDKRELRWENMLAGITSQAAYLRDDGARTLHAQTLDLPLRVPSRIYLVGCGDSHYAGLATRFAFERWSGIPTEALESLEFSRYAIHAGAAGCAGGRGFQLWTGSPDRGMRPRGARARHRVARADVQPVEPARQRSQHAPELDV